MIPGPTSTGLRTNAYGLAFCAEHGRIASMAMTNPNTPAAARQGGSTRAPRLLRRVPESSRGSRVPLGWPTSHWTLIANSR
jgi:hypothetical protein